MGPNKGRVFFDIRDNNGKQRGKTAKVILIHKESGEELNVEFDERYQQFVKSDLEPGSYQVIVEDEDPDLDNQERTLEISPEETEEGVTFHKQIVLPQKGLPVFFQGQEPVSFEPKPHRIAVEFQPTYEGTSAPALSPRL